MPKITVAVDVADFLANGPAPRLAYVTFARATVNSTTSEVITEAPVSARVMQPAEHFQLDSGVAYRVRAYGVRGLAEPFYALTTVSCSLSELYQSHQVDPAALQPILDPPATVAELLAQAVSILTGGAGGALSGSYPNPGLNVAAIDSAVAGRVGAPSSATAQAVQLLIGTAVAQLVGTAPALLDTLGEVAAQLAADESAAAALTAAVAGKAPLASPALTGTPTVPTASSGDSSTRIASTAFVQAALSTGLASVVQAAPAALDSLQELAQAIGNDPTFAADIAVQLAAFTNAVGGVQDRATALEQKTPIDAGDGTGHFG